MHTFHTHFRAVTFITVCALHFLFLRAHLNHLRANNIYTAPVAQEVPHYCSKTAFKSVLTA